MATCNPVCPRSRLGRSTIGIGVSFNEYLQERIITTPDYSRGIFCRHLGYPGYSIQMAWKRATLLSPRPTMNLSTSVIDGRKRSVDASRAATLRAQAVSP